jgi:hypothetical protein
VCYELSFRRAKENWEKDGEGKKEKNRERRAAARLGR